ncbi:MAG: hypothetical protein MUC96_26865 [Myxococcaceae bacterium]|jgi:hypothetical protein|nr:hypothetical protein [Myxococcaceae bacterium]
MTREALRLAVGLAVSVSLALDLGCSAPPASIDGGTRPDTAGGAGVAGGTVAAGGAAGGSNSAGGGATAGGSAGGSAGGGTLDADLRSHEPAGFTVISDQRWTSLTGADWSLPYGTSDTSIISDPTAPDAMLDTQVQVLDYSGTADGLDPEMSYFATNMAPGRAAYVAFFVKFEPGFDFGCSGIKWWLWYEREVINWFGLSDASCGSRFHTRLGPQGRGRLTYVDQQGEQKYVPVLPTAPFFEKDRWHKVQALIDFEADRLRIWVDDVPHTDSDVTRARIGELTTGRTVSLDYAAGARFTEAKQGATWGGGNGYPAPAGSRVRISRTYISGR